MDSILSGLNPRQQEAVSLPRTHSLVLAGAGSGKTRVLVHRLAWLLMQEQLSPYEILAVTFTNKAASEMRQRIESAFGVPTQSLWVGTFHGLSHRLLRLHWQEAGLSETFQVIDSDDQLRMVKRIIKQLGIDDKRFPPRKAQWFINHNKEEGRRAQQVVARQDPFEQTMLRVYQVYEQLCRQSSLVDFAELLLKVTELWQQNQTLRQHYQNRFRHILVDEFQDTNSLQYRWLTLLVNEQNHMTVVGDDDQSIYGWRGAKVENLQRYQNQFQPQVVRLEQNYRSTKTILDAANAVIANNQARMGKALWTDGEDGSRIKVYAAFNEIDEARYIISQIKQQQEAGGRFDECAILYRSNAQSRVLEEALIQAGVPYRIYGGMRFFERAEIKDALAYLRLLFNRHDDAAFERVINTPSRGIGERSLQSIREVAVARQCSLWQAALDVVAGQLVTARAANAINSFIELIDLLDEKTESMLLHEQVEHVIARSNLTAHYEKDSAEKAQTRLENLSELVTAARQFDHSDEAAEAQTPLAVFLTHAVLEAGEGQAEQYDDAVQLMTMHAAKGLEFPVVFIAGMEDELFPSSRLVESPEKLEEERRLCYVGITRAMRQLYLTYAEYRRWYGDNKLHHPSRFLRELPPELIESVRIKSHVSRPVSMGGGRPFGRSTQTTRRLGAAPTAAGLSAQGQTWQVGQQVRHAKFGEGVILNYEGQGDQARLQIKFHQFGMKWLVVGYAKLEKA